MEGEEEERERKSLRKQKAEGQGLRCTKRKKKKKKKKKKKASLRPIVKYALPIGCWGATVYLILGLPCRATHVGECSNFFMTAVRRQIGRKGDKVHP